MRARIGLVIYEGREPRVGRKVGHFYYFIAPLIQ
jgi:hypothetical protein